MSVSSHVYVVYIPVYSVSTIYRCTCHYRHVYGVYMYMKNIEV